MALQVTLLLLGVTVMAGCYTNIENFPTDASNYVTDPNDKWMNHETVKDIEDQLEWGIVHLTEDNMNEIVKKHDLIDQVMAIGKEDTKVAKTSTNSDEEIYYSTSFTELKNQMIFQNLNLTFVIHAVVPLILFYEKVWKSQKYQLSRPNLNDGFDATDIALNDQPQIMVTDF